jgi:hypothetical protein
MPLLCIYELLLYSTEAHTRLLSIYGRLTYRILSSTYLLLFYSPDLCFLSSNNELQTD